MADGPLLDEKAAGPLPTQLRTFVFGFAMQPSKVLENPLTEVLTVTLDAKNSLAAFLSVLTFVLITILLLWVFRGMTFPRWTPFVVGGLWLINLGASVSRLLREATTAEAEGLTASSLRFVRASGSSAFHHFRSLPTRRWLSTLPIADGPLLDEKAAGPLPTQLRRHSFAPLSPYAPAGTLDWLEEE